MNTPTDGDPLRFGSGVSSASDLGRALVEAGSGALEALDGARPDLALVFVSPHHADALDRLPGLVAGTVGARVALGCTAGGVIGAGREVEQRPGVSVTAASLPGVALTPFHLRLSDLPPSGAPAADLAARLGLAADGTRALLLIADPFTFDPEPLLGRLDAALPITPKLGGLASGGRAPGEHALLLGDRLLDEGLIGLGLAGDVAMDTIVAQGCRPIGDPMFVTRARGNLLVELNGRPVLEVLAALFRGLSEQDRELFREALHIGLAMQESQTEYRQGDFLIRNVLGVDEGTKTLVVGARLTETQIVQFHVRDARTSHDDLAAALDGYVAGPGAAHGPPAGALLFSCLGRGIHLNGVPDHDTDLFREKVGPVPLGGFFCNGEIGPVQGYTFLHGYTSCFGLFRRGT
ncbi:MAG: FIST C-terminal domain-containing protein [Acidobacteriota bacterium]